MDATMRRIGKAAAALTMLTLLVGLSAAVTSASAATPDWWWGHSTGSSNNTSSTFNLTAGHPKWNFGNLCNVTKTAKKTLVCDYVGNSSTTHYGYNGCGQCTPALTYNFSGGGKTIYISITNLTRSQNDVVLNVRGSHDTIYLNVQGGMCNGGGTINMTVVGEHDTLNLVVNASGIVGNFYFYLDHAVYNATVWSSGDSLTAWFAGVGTHTLQCPYKNMSASSLYTSALYGNFDSQTYIVGNGENYSTPLNTLWVNGTYFDHVSFENTTTMTCGWSHAPPCPNSRHHFGVSDLQAAKNEP